MADWPNLKPFALRQHRWFDIDQLDLGIAKELRKSHKWARWRLILNLRLLVWLAQIEIQSGLATSQPFDLCIQVQHRWLRRHSFNSWETSIGLICNCWTIQSYHKSSQGNRCCEAMNILRAPVVAKLWINVSGHTLRHSRHTRWKEYI